MSSAPPTSETHALAAEEVVDDAIRAWSGQPGPLLPLLLHVQDRLGHVPPELVGRIAQALDLSRAEVHGVLSFYHDLRTRPPGRRIVRICRAEACQAMGAEALVAHARDARGLALDQTSSDGAHTLLAVYCLGNCALSPSVQVDGVLYGRVDPERLDALLDDLETR